MDRNPDLPSLLDANVPRYTSYPTANHFAAGGGRALAAQFHAAICDAEAVSVYIHIPFCDRMCWFCGCHTKQTAKYDPVQRYITTLCDEIALLQKTISHRPALARLHLGGGSPSLLKRPELSKLRGALSHCFTFTAETEVSIEIDPSDSTSDRIEDLINFGMTRASIGVQDFDPVVQQSINRPQGFELTRDVVQGLRDAGITSVNIDMLYGLPFQTPERLADTAEKVIALAPDRIALFGYAHVPWMKPHQKLIPETALPQAAQRFIDARSTAERLNTGGYESIGIDHFARPHDRLAIAARDGKLRRNFQGYVEDDCAVLIGLGASSISQFGGGFLQNEVASGRYATAIEGGAFAYDRGLAVTADDQARGWIIERIMCAFRFSKHDMVRQLGDAATFYWSLVEKLAQSKLEDYVTLQDDVFTLRTEARPFARSIASAFDSSFNAAISRHSAAV